MDITHASILFSHLNISNETREWPAKQQGSDKQKNRDIFVQSGVGMKYYKQVAIHFSVLLLLLWVLLRLLEICSLLFVACFRSSSNNKSQNPVQLLCEVNRYFITAAVQQQKQKQPKKKNENMWWRKVCLRLRRRVHRRWVISEHVQFVYLCVS